MAVKLNCHFKELLCPDKEAYFLVDHLSWCIQESKGQRATKEGTYSECDAVFPVVEGISHVTANGDCNLHTLYPNSWWYLQLSFLHPKGKNLLFWYPSLSNPHPPEVTQACKRWRHFAISPEHRGSQPVVAWGDSSPAEVCPTGLSCLDEWTSCESKCCTVKHVYWPIFFYIVLYGENTF